jgi:hypothetical protein
VAERWFEHETVDDGVLRIREKHVDPFLQANLFLVRGRDRDVLVDTDSGSGPFAVSSPTCSNAPWSPWRRTGTSTTPAGLHEFEEVVVHRDDAEAVANADGFASLRIEDYPPEELSGYDPPASLLDAIPHEGFDLGAYAVASVAPTRIVDEGDEIDLGDRRITVLHLPGHTPGEIGLWEEATRTLFSGDCVYESGILLDELPESNIADYVRSMERLREVPLRIVHGGHDDSFGRPRLLELIDGYVRART